jgi:hypothetical protein
MNTALIICFQKNSEQELYPLMHIEVKLLTYQEMLSILRDSVNEYGIPKEEIGCN